MLPEIVELVSDSRSIREIDQDLTISHSFFNKKLGKPALMEAWERSVRFSRTRIRDRGMYFLCLITGERNLDKAKEIGGYRNDDKRSYIIYEDQDRQFIDNLEGITCIPYTNLLDEGKTFYFEMTMVELELIHK